MREAPVREAPRAESPRPEARAEVGRGEARQESAQPETRMQETRMPEARASGITRTSEADSREETVRASSKGVKVKATKRKKPGTRSVNLTVASVDLWSVSKMALLLSVALGIATIVAFLVVWLVLQSTGTLDSVRSTLGEIAGPESTQQILSLLGLGPVMSFAVILAVVNLVLMTALATLFGFLYNLGASIVGGFRLTLVDD